MKRWMLNSQGRMVQALHGEYVEYAEARSLLRRAVELLEHSNRILQHDRAAQFLQHVAIDHRLSDA